MPIAPPPLLPPLWSSAVTGGLDATVTRVAAVFNILVA